MKHLRLPSLLAIALLTTPLAFAQAAPAYTPTSLVPDASLPRTPDGRPDFQGVVWATNYFPVFDTNPMSPDLVVSEQEAKRIVDTMFSGMTGFIEKSIDPEAAHLMGDTDGLPVVRGERRTRLIVLPADGKLPMTPEAQALADKPQSMVGERDDYEQRPLSERCLALSGAPPMYAVIAYNRLEIVQTPGAVVIHNENGDETRIIPFTATHPPSDPRSWSGDSIARWEGDTLVIETIRNNPHQIVRGLMSNFVVNPDATVIERFTRVSATELLYQFTVEDPKAYTAPWLGEFSFHASNTGMYPSPCHEHNISLPNILMGARMTEHHTK